jgi:hypothetical protein
MSLAQHPCRARCAWVRSPLVVEPPRFSCRGCGSQWDREQGWTPCDADLSVPVEVAEQVAVWSAAQHELRLAARAARRAALRAPSDGRQPPGR